MRLGLLALCCIGLQAAPATAAPGEIEQRLNKLLRWYLAEESPVRREDYLEAIELLTRGKTEPVVRALQGGRHRVPVGRPALSTRLPEPIFDQEDVRLQDVSQSAGNLAQLLPPDDYDPKKTYALTIDLGSTAREHRDPGAFSLHVNHRRYPRTAQGTESLVLSLQRHMLATYPIDPARVTLQGEKGTARLAWYIALHNPDRYGGVMAAFDTWRGAVPLAANATTFYALGIDKREPSAAMKELMKALRKHNEMHRLLDRNEKSRSQILADIRHWRSYAERKEAPPRKLTLVLDRPDPMRAYWLRAHPSGRSKYRAKVGSRTALAMRKHGKIEAEIFEGNLVVVTCEGVVAFDLFVDPRLIDVDKPVRVAINGPYPQAQAVFPNVADLLEDFAERRDSGLLYVCKLTFAVR